MKKKCATCKGDLREHYHVGETTICQSCYLKQLPTLPKRAVVETDVHTIRGGAQMVFEILKDENGYYVEYEESVIIGKEPTSRFESVKAAKDDIYFFVKSNGYYFA